MNECRAENELYKQELIRLRRLLERNLAAAAEASQIDNQKSELKD